MGLVISDAHEGLRQAIEKVFSGAAWQRCRVRFMRSLLSVVPRAAQETVAAVVRTVFLQPTTPPPKRKVQLTPANIETAPATVDRFDDVASVLGPKRPDASVCWCLSHRLDSKTNRELVGPARGKYVRQLCSRDVAPGVLAYDDGVVAGWAAVAPRSELPFARSRKIPHVDDLPVWSVWCIRVRPGHRGKGISHALLEGAVGYALSQGAPAVEGYPVDNRGEKVDLTMAYVGTRSLFERAGFTKAADTDSVSGGFPRVLMRLLPS